MPPDAQLDVDFCLICDDVRREDTGKFILIGVYTNNIGVAPGLPELRVMAAVNMRASAVGEYRFQVRGRFEGSAVAHLEGRFVATEPGTTFGVLPLQILGLRRAGILSVEVKHLPDGEWHEVRALPVMLEASSPP
jgi:hypothetical protein